MRILCTGGCGFLGSNLVSEALARGDEVCVFDNLSRYGAKQNLDFLRALGLRHFVEADIRERGRVRDLIAEFKPETVFHVAGQVAMTTSLSAPLDDAEINIIGTLNVLEAVRTSAPGAGVVYSSTNKVYGDLDGLDYEETDWRYVVSSRPDGFDEATPLDFRSPYGCSKGSADQYVLDYARLYGLNGVVFRHSSMYGDRQFATADQGWVGWFVMKAIEIASTRERSGTISVSGTGKQVRDMLYAQDMVDLYFRAANQAGRVRGEAFNIGGGPRHSRSILELFRDLEAALGCRIDIESKPRRASDQKVFIADVRKAERLLGWVPQISCDEGLDRMIRWSKALA